MFNAHPQCVWIMRNRRKTIDRTHTKNVLTHHVDDLHERQTEAQLQRIRLVHHRPFQHIVRVQQIVQQAFFVRSRMAYCVCVC